VELSVMRNARSSFRLLVERFQIGIKVIRFLKSMCIRSNQKMSDGFAVGRWIGSDNVKRAIGVLGLLIGIDLRSGG
jgi:hypothetical protein